MLPNDDMESAMEIRTMGDLGALVRKARTARGMTQADLAARLHMSRDWVVRLEKGHPRLEAQRVLDALRLVGVNLDATILDIPLAARRKDPQGKPEVEAKVDPFDALFGTNEP